MRATDSRDRGLQPYDISNSTRTILKYRSTLQQFNVPERALKNIHLQEDDKKDQARDKVIIVIPAFNEEKAIGNVLKELRDVLQDLDFDSLVVDGESTDRTVEIARSEGARVIRQQGAGYGDALRSGFDYACDSLGATIVAMMDADGTYSAKSLRRVLEPVIRGEADLVIGNRFAGLKPRAMSLVNRAGNIILSDVARWAIKARVTDTQSGLRALTSQAWRLLDMKMAGMPFAIEMIAEAREVGCIMTEVPIDYYPRIGFSKLSPTRDGLGIIVAILRLMRDYQPLTFFGGLGSVAIVVGMAIGSTVIVEWLRFGVITRLASVVLSSTLIVTGVLVLVLGLVADMIRDVKHFLRKVREPRISE